MKLHRRLSLRILLVAVASGAVGLASATMSSRYATERLGAHVLESWLKRSSARQKARCEEQPHHFTVGIAEGPQVFAYDAVTHVSLNSAAPPLDAMAYQRLPSAVNEPVSQIQTSLLGSGGVVMIRAGNAGPCAILQAVWPATGADSRGLFVACAGVLSAVLAAMALGFFLVVRPFAARVQRLSGAASHVGDSRGYSSPLRADDDELDRIAGALDRAHERIRADAQRLDERRRYLERYLADVAHDLRTPLTSMQLAIERAADDARDPGQTELFAGVLRDCVYLGGLVSNLRLAAELEEGWDPVKMAPQGGADLKEVVERVIERLLSLARRRGIDLAFTTPDNAVRVNCDPVACEQAIGNLVENAVSYGDRGGHVAVLLQIERTNGFGLTVMDDGPGVAQTEIPRLGERTFRSDEARRRDPRGSGLGLAITGEICKRAGFSLSFEPAGERGLCVRIRGPLASG